MVAIDGGLFDRLVHSLDLTMGPGMFNLSQPVFDVTFSTNTVEDRLKGMVILCPVGQLNTVIRQYRMNSVGNGRHELAQKLCCLPLSRCPMSLGISELAGSVNRDKQIKLAFIGVSFGNIDVEITDGNLFEFLFLAGLFPSVSGKREIPWRCSQRCSQERER